MPNKAPVLPGGNKSFSKRIIPQRFVVKVWLPHYDKVRGDYLANRKLTKRMI